MTDQALKDAWDRRVAAFTAYNALPFSDCTEGTYTPAEAAQWAIIDEAEETIRATSATTVEGVLTQLWTGFGHALCKREDEQAALQRDLAYFDERDGALDFTERLILAALRSLTKLV
jgi:hypothetical protein